MPVTSQLEEEVTRSLLFTVKNVVRKAFELYDGIPGHEIITGYIKKSYQDDPFRILLECLLIAFTIKYLLAKRYSINKNLEIELTTQEEDELIDEWNPKPLVPPAKPETCHEIIGPICARPKTAFGTLLNFGSYNFLDFANNKELKDKAIKALRSYGVGACGPPGFYGTLDVHLELEKAIASFLGTESAIIYSQGFAAVSSVVPAFAKRTDLLVCDEGISFALQKGVQISRAHVRYYKHNDMEDLEAILESIDKEKSWRKKPMTRKFIVTEGLFLNHGDFAFLPALVQLKKKYKYRLIVDESFSFGAIGARGAGLTDYYMMPADEVDIICGSLSNALASSGGFCAGSIHVTDHQRLSSQGYCFSAALPALSAVAAKGALDFLENLRPSPIAKLFDNICLFRLLAGRYLTSQQLELVGNLDSPILHLRFSANARLENVEDEEDYFQKIVDYAAQRGVMLTRARYNVEQELKRPAPSIRIAISSAFSENEIETLVTVLDDALKYVVD